MMFFSHLLNKISAGCFVNQLDPGGALRFVDAGAKPLAKQHCSIN